MKKPIGNAQEQSGYVIQRKSDGKFYSLRHDGIAQWVSLERAKRFPVKRVTETVASSLGHHQRGPILDGVMQQRWISYNCTVEDVKSLRMGS